MNSVYTIDLLDRGLTSQAPASGFWRVSHEGHPEKAFDLSRMAAVAGVAFALTVSTVTVTAMPDDPWLQERMRRDAVVTRKIIPMHQATTVQTGHKLMIIDLGWSLEDAIETRMRLRTFEEDWDAPGMEGYDEL